MYVVSRHYNQVNCLSRAGGAWDGMLPDPVDMRPDIRTSYILAGAQGAIMAWSALTNAIHNIRCMFKCRLIKAGWSVVAEGDTNFWFVQQAKKKGPNKRSIPFHIGSGSRTRTCDPMINSHLLYQLSYAGLVEARAGIEPACKDLQSSA